MPKELTRRQKQFLSQFLDIYQEKNGPIHYVGLAKRLDIGKITAYEMLRLLEKRGLVEAEYHLPPGNRGPGRSEVFFRPTKEATRVFERLSENTSDNEEWEIIKQRILKELQDGKAAGYETLLNDLLVRIPEQRSPLIFMTEMVTTIILTLTPMKKAVEDKGLLDRLSRIGLPGEIGLIALSGFGIALSLVEDINLRFSTFLLEHSGKYQEMLAQLSEEKRKQLSDFTRDVIKIVKG
jgi:DNA-binding MarR family transcriptional regulator